MPKIDTYTAQGRDGILRLPGVSPDSFGRQAFEQISETGKQFEAIGAKIQDNQDRLDLIELSGAHAVRLDEAKTEILQHPDRAQHGELLEKKSQKIYDELLAQYPSVSTAVKTTFQQHVAQGVAPAIIDLRHQGLALAIEKQTVDVDQRGQEIAAAHGRSGQLYAVQAMQTTEDLLSPMIQNMSVHPKAAQVMREGWSNVYWEQRAMHNPHYVLGVTQTGKASAGDFPMDPQKSLHYQNISLNVLHSLDAKKRQDAADALALFKQKQTDTKNEFYSMALQGKVVPKEWYAGKEQVLGDEFEGVAKDAIASNIKGGPGAGSDHIGQWEKRILVDNEVGDTARKRIFDDPKLNRDQRIYLEGKVRTREHEIESGKDAKYFANEPRFKDYEVRVKKLLGDAPWLPILKPGDQKVLGEAIVELRARVEAASLTEKNWQARIPEIASQVMVNHQPRLSGGVATPKDWQGDLDKSVKELQKEFLATGKAGDALLQHPEYRRRATQLLTYDAYVKRFPNRLVPSTTPSKGTQEKPQAIQELFQKLLESSAEESS